MVNDVPFEPLALSRMLDFMYTGLHSVQLSRDETCSGRDLLEDETTSGQQSGYKLVSTASANTEHLSVTPSCSNEVEAEPIVLVVHAQVQAIATSYTVLELKQLALKVSEPLRRFSRSRTSRVLSTRYTRTFRHRSSHFVRSFPRSVGGI